MLTSAILEGVEASADARDLPQVFSLGAGLMRFSIHRRLWTQGEGAFPGPYRLNGQADSH